MRAEWESWSTWKRVWVLGALVLFTGWLLLRPFSAELVDVSLAGWTWKACNSMNGFLHGRLVPLLFAGMLWWWIYCSRDEEVRPSYWGLGWLVVGMVIYWAGVRVLQPRWALFALPFLLVGLTHYCLGGKLARGVAPAVFFLWFMIPVPGLETWIGGHVFADEIEATAMAANWLGIETVQEGARLKSGEVEVSFASI